MSSMFINFFKKNKENEPSIKKQNYFTSARSWADDIYTTTISSRNRYRFAFCLSMGLSCLLTLSIIGLIPLQHLSPLLIHHYEDGRIMVEPLKQPYAPKNKAQVESEIARYIIQRESYSPSSYDLQYSLINTLSNNKIAKKYMAEQNAHNPNSPINILGNKGYRTVHIDNIVFLDNVSRNKKEEKRGHTHNNLAEVNFTITDHYEMLGKTKSIALSALLSWKYRGTPKKPEDIWRNWNGFTVTHYSIQQRNV